MDGARTWSIVRDTETDTLTGPRWARRRYHARSMDHPGRPNDSRGHPLDRRLVGGRYTIEGLLGRGAMGSVYRARHVLTNNQVALKCILPSETQREQVVARFRREVSISAHVNHEGIVKVFDAGEDNDGTLYLAMELLEGETLQARAQRPDFTAGQGINIIRAMLEALSEVHAVGFVHRDIKPENIFVQRAVRGPHRIKLLDFGIASAPEGQSSTLPDVGLGTPLYMSPEQATNARAAGSTADVWSVGVMLYWLLAGRLPFRADTTFNTIALACTSPHAPIPTHANPIIARLAAVVDRALDKDPDRRPRDASQLKLALDDILGPLDPANSVSTLPTGPATRWMAKVPVPEARDSARDPPLVLQRSTLGTPMAISSVAPPPPTAQWWWAALALVIGTGLLLGVFIMQAVTPRRIGVVQVVDIERPSAPAGITEVQRASDAPPAPPLVPLERRIPPGPTRAETPRPRNAAPSRQTRSQMTETRRRGPRSSIRRRSPAADKTTAGRNASPVPPALDAKPRPPSPPVLAAPPVSAAPTRTSFTVPPAPHPDREPRVDPPPECARRCRAKTSDLDPFEDVDQPRRAAAYALHCARAREEAHQEEEEAEGKKGATLLDLLASVRPPMNTRYAVCFLLLLGPFTVATPLRALASPWTLTRGTSLMRAGFDFQLATSEFIDEGGERAFPLNGRFSGATLDLGLRLGLTDSLEIEVGIPARVVSYTSDPAIIRTFDGQNVDDALAFYQNNLIDFSQANAGIADIRLFARYQLLLRPFAVAAQIGVKIPTGYDGPEGTFGTEPSSLEDFDAVRDEVVSPDRVRDDVTLGDGQVDVSAQLLAGHAFSTGTFVRAAAGYNLRLAGAGDQVLGDVRLGQALTDRFLLFGFARLAYSIERGRSVGLSVAANDPDQPASSFANFQNAFLYERRLENDALDVGGGLIWRVAGPVELNVAYGRTVWGRFTAATNTLSVAFGLRMGMFETSPAEADDAS